MKSFRLVLASLLALFAPTVQAVTCASNIPAASNPDSAYAVHGDGTVTDQRTGLMWKVCAEGQNWSNGTCSGATTHTWAAALALAEGAVFANHSDWRLPNVKELRSLVEECRSSPSINNTVFPNTPISYFWSGSPRADRPDRAWAVHFLFGITAADFRISAHSVRLVRGGQSSGANRPPVIGNATFGVTSKQLAGSFNVADADNDAIKNIRLTMRGSGFYCRTGYLSKAFDQAINTGLINIVSTDCAAEATRFMNESGGAVTWELELYDSKGAKATSATGSLNQQGSITVPAGSKVIWTDSVTDFEIGTGYTLQFKMVDAQNNVLSQYSSVGAINVTGVDVEMDGKRLVWFDNGVANVTGFKAVSAGIGEIEVSAPVKYILPTQDLKQSGVELLTTGAVASVVLRASRAIKALSACPANPKLYVRLEQPDGSPVGTGQIQVGKVINQTVPAWTTYTKSGDVVELAGTIINPGEVVSIRYMPPNSVNWIDAGKIENLGKTCFSKSFTNKLAYKITSGKRPLILIPGIFGSTLDDKVNPYPIMPKSICKTKSDDCAKLEFYSALGDFLGWNELEEKLISMGYKVYRAPWDWRMGNLNDIAAQFLAPVIDQALKDSPGYTRVDVVAHSMGGLVTRAYIQNLGKGNAIDRFVMLGTPNGGSVNAYYLMSAVEMIKLDRAVQDIGAMLLKPDFYSNTANNVFRGMGMGALLSDGWFGADTNEGHGVSGYSYLYKDKKNRREAIKLAVPGGTNLLPLSTHDYLQALDFSNMTTSNRAATNNSDLSLLYNKGRENLLCNLSPKDRWGYDTDTNSAYTWLLLSANEKTITRAKASLDSSKTEFANLVDDYSPSIDYLFSNGTLQFVATENSGDGTVPAAWATDGIDGLSGCIHQLNGGGHARMPGNLNIQSELFDILRLNRSDISMAHSENKFIVASDAPASFLNVQLAGPVVGLLSGSGGGVGVDSRSEFISTLPNATYQTLSDLSSYRVSPVEAGVYQLQLSAPVGFSGRLLPVDIHSNISGYNQLIRGYHIIGNSSVAIKFSLSTQGVLLLLDRPYRPRNLIINFSSDQQNTLISWDAPTDGTTTGYRIYSRLEGKQNFGLIATLSAGQLSYTYNGAAISSTSATPITEFVVVAIDAQGRESLASDIVSNVRQESVSDMAFAGQSTFESNAWVASSSITLSSINVPVAISINGGEYKLDNGAFTSAPGIVQPGQSVAVRVRSSATVGGTSMATLTVGESTMTFTVATLSKTHTLTVSKSGRGSGQVVSNPAGIDCGSACAAGFTTGAGVDLYATADEGSRFVGWSGACSGRATCSVTMADDKSVGATFTRKANSASTLAVIMAVLLDSQPAVSYAASPAVGVNADGSTIWLRLDSITGSKANFSIGKISGNFLSSGVFRILNNANYTGQEVNYTAGATTVSFAYELGTVPASHVIKAQRYDAANIAGGYDSNVVSGPVTVNVTLK